MPNKQNLRGADKRAALSAPEIHALVSYIEKPAPYKTTRTGWGHFSIGVQAGLPVT